MKNTSVRISPSALLVLSILFVGVVLLLRFNARAKAETLAPEGEPGLSTQTKSQGPKIQTPAGNNVTQPTWRFVIKNKYELQSETITLSSPCADPHRFRVRSDTAFFRLEQQAESVLLGANLPKRLEVSIDASKLKPGPHRVRMSVECLDCANDQFCIQVKNVLLAEVFVLRSSTPTPTPTPTVDEAAKRRKEALELFDREGPSIPEVYSTSEFKFGAVVEGEWQLRFDYDLTQPATLMLTVTVEGLLPYVYELPGMKPGRHEEVINLPRQLGGLNPAFYSIRALPDSPTGDDVEIFTLRSLTAGGRALGSAGLEQEGLGGPSHSIRTASYQPFAVRPEAFAPGPPGVGTQTGASWGFDRITFMPREVRVVHNRPSMNATYSFRALLNFSGGAKADIILAAGGSNRRVSRKSYDRRLAAGDALNSSWDCMKDGAPSLGRHRMFVSAWSTIQDGGKFAFGNSLPLVVRR